jgi:hypothetical protein
MEIEEEYITEPQQNTRSISIYNSDVSENYKDANDEIVIFRNKIYIIKKYHYTLWSIYEYFSSTNKTEKELGVTNLLFMLHTDTHKLDTYSDEFKGITYDAFVSEKQQITEADVPQKIMECLVKLQYKNVAKVIPYEKITEAEAHHLKALQADIDAHINSLMMNIYIIIDKSKTPVEKIKYPYIAHEHTIKNGVKIYYKFPNTDGALRPTFKEYFHYLFQKLYPMPETSDAPDQISINQYKIYELLKNKYTFLQIDYVGAPNYIEVHLPLQKVLH